MNYMNQIILINQNFFMSPTYAASLGQACQAYENTKKKAHTRHKAHKSQLQAAHNQKDLYYSVFLRSSTTTTYTAASSSGHLPPLHRTPRSWRERSCCVCNSEVRIRTISICHSHTSWASDGVNLVNPKSPIIAERLSTRHWIAECGQRWQQVLYTYIYIYMYVRHAFGMQLNFCDVIATSRIGSRSGLRPRRYDARPRVKCTN